jgi:hypothetical protein
VGDHVTINVCPGTLTKRRDPSAKRPDVSPSQLEFQTSLTLLACSSALTRCCSQQKLIRYSAARWPCTSARLGSLGEVHVLERLEEKPNPR